MTGSATTNTRRSLVFSFAGANGDRGTLNPGEALIVDFMMQFDENRNATTDSGTALVMQAYADKAGSYEFYDYPFTTLDTSGRLQYYTSEMLNSSDSTVNKDSSYRSDLSDGNGNGDSSETLLRIDAPSVGWKENDDVKQDKQVVPHYTDEMFKYRSGTAAVTEGSSYRWWLIDQYAGTSDVSALMYKHATFVDRLPEKDDYEASTYDSSGDVYNLRQSQWSGWLKDLDAIKAYYTDTTVNDATQNQVGMYEIRTKDEVDPITGVMNPKQVDVWLGPLKVERNTDGMFVRGRAVVAGLDDDKGRELVIEFQNENIIARADGKALCTSPDLIMSLDMESGTPVTTEGLKYGARIVVVGMPCDDQWRTPEGLAVVGPRAFGYDLDYVPVEELAATEGGR